MPRLRLRFSAGLALFVALSSAGFVPLRAAERLVGIDGTQQTAAIDAIDADGIVRFADGREPLPLMTLDRIELREAAAPADDTIRVHLATGGILCVSRIGVEKESVHLDHTLLGDVRLPLSSVRALRLAPAPDARQIAAWRETREHPADTDQLLAFQDKQVHTLAGVLLAIQPQHVVFRYRGQERTVKRDKVLGLVLSPPPRPDRPPARYRLTLTDGSTLEGSTLHMEAQRLRISLDAENTLAMPWSALARIRVYSDRVVYLADRTPLRVRERALVTLDLPWQRNRSAVGTPLRLGERRYERGLGVHAASRLTFAVPANARLFLATIGLDASAGGKGDCVFRVLGDGRELFAKRMRGTDASHALRVPLTGVRELTLDVVPGAELDLGDRADWCDARIVR